MNDKEEALTNNNVCKIESLTVNFPKIKVDTTKHVKIWFNKTPDEWMPLKNKLRLIRHRRKNPNHLINLIGKNDLLSESEIINRNDF